MDGRAPVFTNSEDIRLWKRLSSAERSVSRRKDGKSAKLSIVIKEISLKESPLEPRIAAKAMELADKYLQDDVQHMIIQLANKCNLSDSLPNLTAAKILFKLHSYDIAASILDRMTLRNDLTMWEFIRGRIYQVQGDTDNAYSHLVQCYKSDEQFMPVYDRLHSLRPEEGWDLRKRIAEILSHTPTTSDAAIASSPLGDLISYYEQWDNGNRSVVQSVRSSQPYRDNDADYILASARMSDDAKTMIQEYRKIPEPSYSILVELAHCLMDDERYPATETVCRNLSLKNTGDRRLNELLIELYTRMNDRSGLMSSVQKYLSYDYADTDAYSYACEHLIRLSMNADASILIDRMLESGVPDAYYLSAKNDRLMGRHTHALRSIKKALKKDPENVDALILKARILLELGKESKAMGNLEYVLSTYGDVPEALAIKRDRLASRGDLEGAYSLCERIRAVSGDSPELLGYMADLLEKMGRPDDAVRLYRDAIGIRVDPQLFIQVMTSFVRDGKYEDAASMAAEYDDTYGNMQATWILKGNAEYACGKYADAYESYERALEIDHSDPVLWHSRGLAAEAIEDYTTAEDAYDRAVILDLENPDYWISRSVIKEKTGDLIAAVDSLNHVISEYPENTYALMRKSHILANMGRFRDALVFADLASKIESDNFDIMRFRRDLNDRIPDLEKARRLSRDMVLLRPDDTAVRLDYAKRCINDKDYDDALLTLSDGPKDDKDMLRLRSRIYILIGNREGVIRTCNDILKIDPNDEETMMLLADTYTETGEKGKASELYERLNSLRPDDAEIMIKQAKVDSDIDKETVLSTLAENIKSDPNDTESLLRLADELVAMERYDEAEDYIDRAIESAPDNPVTYLKKAKIKMDLGLYKEALSVLDEAKGNSIIQDARIWEYAGDVHDALGDRAQALLSYESAVKMDDSLPGIYTKIGEFHERGGSIDAAMEFYQKAYEKNARDTRAMYRMARILFSEGKNKTANRYVDEIIATGTVDADTLLLKCRILADSKDADGISDIIDIAEEKGIDHRTIDEMELILNDVRMEPAEITDDETDVRDMAVELLKCSYENGTPLDDPATLSAAGIDPSKMGMIMVFLSDIDRCRDFAPSGEWFDRMESLSNSAICKSNIDIDNSPMLPLQTALFTAGADSIEEAKELVSYVYKVMTSDIEPIEFNETITSICNRIGSTGDLPNVRTMMTDYGIGVYSARTVVLLLKERDGSIIDHI